MLKKHSNSATMTSTIDAKETIILTSDTFKMINSPSTNKYHKRYSKCSIRRSLFFAQYTYAFLYLSIICMLYCVIYRVFLYYALYIDKDFHSFFLTIYHILLWIILGGTGILLLCILCITVLRIFKDDKFSPTNIRLLFLISLRFLILFILHFIVLICADSMILFTFLNFMFEPGNNNFTKIETRKKYTRITNEANITVVDSTSIFWHSVKMFLENAENKKGISLIFALYLLSFLYFFWRTDKFNRLIVIHYYCINLYLAHSLKFSNNEMYSGGIFGREQQTKAVACMKPIIFNEYFQRDPTPNKPMRFLFSTPSSIQGRIPSEQNFYQQRLNNKDLQLWFSLLLWSPVFKNDDRYHLYFIIEKVLCKILLLVLLLAMIYLETMIAFKINLFPTANYLKSVENGNIRYFDHSFENRTINILSVVRCAAEVMAVLCLIPYYINVDEDFDNLTELYNSREVSETLAKKSDDDICQEITLCYNNYCRMQFNEEMEDSNTSESRLRSSKSHSYSSMDRLDIGIHDKIGINSVTVTPF